MNLTSLKSTSSFLDAAYREGLKCLDNEKLGTILDLKHGVDLLILDAQREELKARNN